jgi:hypothetical protein
MNFVILKFNAATGNQWGNEAHRDGVGLLTLGSIAQATVDVVAAGGQVYLYKKNYFGPMTLDPVIFHVRGAGYRLRLRGDLGSPARGFLGPVAQRVQQVLATAEGVVVSGRAVKATPFKIVTSRNEIEIPKEPRRESTRRRELDRLFP